MNYWLFQARTDRYDLRDPSKIQPGQKETWDATRYRTEMNPGDIVFFWLAGDSDYRGIYGWGTLLSPPHPGYNKDFVVDVRFDERFKNFLSVQEIAADSDLADLLILRVPIGANFLISASEAQAIARHVKPPDVAPRIAL